MRRDALTFCFVLSCLGFAASAAGQTHSPLPKLETYVQQRMGEFDKISDERKQALADLSAYVKKQRSANDAIHLTFICTHNSRRSHLAQLWAAVAADFHEIPSVRTYSGGTEGTAFNPRAIAALQRAGFRIDQKTKGDNPRYAVTFAKTAEPMTCFSKVYDQAPNPKRDFCAVMVCSDADENCPLVRGAKHRIAIPYVDPKVADGTPAEAGKYDERCAQIAREMLYAFLKAK